MLRRILLATLLLAPSVASATDAKVTIDNFTFSPARLTVPVGTRVTWSNRDDMPHTITSAEIPRLLKSPPLDTDGTFAFTFTHPGVYRYFCSIHAQMQGTIVVQ